MFLYIKTLLSYAGAVGVAGIILFLFVSIVPESRTPSFERTTTSDVGGVVTPQAEISVPTSTAPSTSASIETPEEKIKASSEEHDVASSIQAATHKGAATSSSIERIKEPYPYPPLALETLNLQARAALVNIFCSMQEGSPRAIVGSGIFIDARGVILTNAHVGQYVLLAEDSRVNLSCVIRHGSPARALWKAEVLYIPSVWIEEHAEEITAEHAKGTGEHDYALLRITGTVDGTPLPTTFPALLPDTREAIGFLGDPVLAASYPAEFVKNAYSLPDLYPLTSTATIQEFLTFKAGTVDLISVGGIPGAQGGSSGGGVINLWGRLIGIISTTSEGETTADRDLRAITLNYIDHDLVVSYGENLAGLLNGDITAKAADFMTNKASTLIELLIKGLFLVPVPRK